MRSYQFSKTLLVGLLSAALLLAACGRDEPAPTVVPPTPLPAVTTAAEPTEAEAAGEAEAASASQPESPLQSESPLADPNSPLPTPTPNVSGVEAAPGEETGSVIGRLYVRRSTGDIPIVGLIVGLADVLVGEDGMPMASGYDPASPYRFYTDDQGGFAINDVPPGLYSIILDAVSTQYQLSDPNTGDTILAEVEAGGVYDVGNLYYDSLPLPGLSVPQ